MDSCIDLINHLVWWSFHGMLKYNNARTIFQEHTQSFCSPKWMFSYNDSFKIINWDILQSKKKTVEIKQKRKQTPKTTITPNTNKSRIKAPRIQRKVSTFISLTDHNECDSAQRPAHGMYVIAFQMKTWMECNILVKNEMETCASVWNT